MSKKKLAEIIGVCTKAIMTIIVITVFQLACQGATTPTTPKPPTYGLEFDGIDDCISLGKAGNTTVLGFTSQDFTIEAWIKPDTVTSRMQIFQRQTYNNDGYRFEVSPTKKQLAFYTFQSGDNQVTVTSLNVLTAGNWHHVVAVRKGASVKLYVNGVDRTGVPNSHIDPAYVAWRYTYIGSNYTPEVFDGIISEVRVWDYARTGSEIKADMYKELTGTEEGLIGYWKLNEGSGTIAHDSTANNNHGTLVGDPVWFTGGG